MLLTKKQQNKQKKLIISDYNFWIIFRYCDDVLVQALHLKDGSTFNLPLIFEHLLWTQWLQLLQKIESLPTRLRQVPHGHFTGSVVTDELCLLHTSFYYWRWRGALEPFLPWLSFQILIFFFKSSNVSATNTRSSA